MSFNKSYEKIKKNISSILCVGLDPVLEKILLLNIPENFYNKKISETNLENKSFDLILYFLEKIIEYTKNYAVAYKINSAFFEAFGVYAFVIFFETVKLIRKIAPDALIIADAKRSDIEYSASAYSKTFFENLDCDAVTVNPYLGIDSIEAFSKYKEKATIVLCLTSNPGSKNFQTWGEEPLYLEIAKTMSELNEKTENIWLVVGATNEKKQLLSIREVAPKLPFLIPGIGTQNGDLNKCLEATGTNVLINLSRGILYKAEKFNDLEGVVVGVCESLLKEMRKFL